MHKAADGSRNVAHGAEAVLLNNLQETRVTLPSPSVLPKVQSSQIDCARYRGVLAAQKPRKNWAPAFSMDVTSLTRQQETQSGR